MGLIRKILFDENVPGTAWVNGVCTPHPKPAWANGVCTPTSKKTAWMNGVCTPTPQNCLDTRFKPSPAHGTHQRADPMRRVPSVAILWLEVRTLGLQNPCPPLGVTIVKNFTPIFGVTIVKNFSPPESEI